MSALRALPDITPSRRAPAKLPQKPPQLSVIAGKKGETIAAVKSPLKAKSPVAFIAICIFAVVASLVFVLVASAKLIDNQLELSKVQAELRVVQQDIQAKEEQLQLNQANLVNKAAELGLVRADNPEPIDITAYVAAVTGEVIGGVSARSGK